MVVSITNPKYMKLIIGWNVEKLSLTFFSKMYLFSSYNFIKNYFIKKAGDSPAVKRAAQVHSIAFTFPPKELQLTTLAGLLTRIHPTIRPFPITQWFDGIRPSYRSGGLFWLFTKFPIMPILRHRSYSSYSVDFILNYACFFCKCFPQKPSSSILLYP